MPAFAPTEQDGIVVIRRPRHIAGTPPAMAGPLDYEVHRDR
jgi:hypothetical protein